MLLSKIYTTEIWFQQGKTRWHHSAANEQRSEASAAPKFSFHSEGSGKILSFPIGQQMVMIKRWREIFEKQQLGRHLCTSASSDCRLGSGWHRRCRYPAEGNVSQLIPAALCQRTFTLNLASLSFLIGKKKRPDKKIVGWLWGGDSGWQVGRKGGRKQASGWTLELVVKGGNHSSSPASPPLKTACNRGDKRSHPTLFARIWVLCDRVIAMFRPSHHPDGRPASFEIWRAASTGREAVSCIDRFPLSLSSFIY